MVKLNISGLFSGKKFFLSGNLVYSRKSKFSTKLGQMKIQQMAFMLLAVFLFFILVGLFFLNVHLRGLHKNADQLYTEAAISSFQTLIYMPELTYYGQSNSLDEDKLRVMSGKVLDYSEFWPVESIKVYKIYPSFQKEIKCPAIDCNYYDIYNSGQKNIHTVSTFVSICSRVNDAGFVYDKCEIGKLVVGVINKNDE